MEIESRLGEGTQVTIRLPIDCENPGVVRKGGGLAVGATQNIAELPIVSSWSDLQVKKRA
jgi:hypothetical protein